MKDETRIELYGGNLFDGTDIPVEEVDMTASMIQLAANIKAEASILGHNVRVTIHPESDGVDRIIIPDDAPSAFYLEVKRIIDGQFVELDDWIAMKK